MYKCHHGPEIAPVVIIENIEAGFESASLHRIGRYLGWLCTRPQMICKSPHTVRMSSTGEKLIWCRPTAESYFVKLGQIFMNGKRAFAQFAFNDICVRWKAIPKIMDGFINLIHHDGLFAHIHCQPRALKGCINPLLWIGFYQATKGYYCPRGTYKITTKRIEAISAHGAMHATAFKTIRNVENHNDDELWLTCPIDVK